MRCFRKTKEEGGQVAREMRSTPVFVAAELFLQVNARQLTEDNANCVL